MTILRFPALALGLLALAPVSATAQSTHSVRGYTRANVTYVAPHMQTNPNGTKLDNWSTRGNVNPYNGKEGTRDPYASPTRSTSGSSYGNPYPRSYR